MVETWTYTLEQDLQSYIDEAWSIYGSVTALSALTGSTYWTKTDSGVVTGSPFAVVPVAGAGVGTGTSAGFAADWPFGAWAPVGYGSLPNTTGNIVGFVGVSYNVNAASCSIDTWTIAPATGAATGPRATSQEPLDGVFNLDADGGYDQQAPSAN
jgi:hypothetical protein